MRAWQKAQDEERARRKTLKTPRGARDVIKGKKHKGIEYKTPKSSTTGTPRG